MLSSILVILWILSVINALDCSQFTDLKRCVSTSCSWTQLECKCASPANLDILFTISTSSYIGRSNFNNLLLPWLNKITSNGINTGLAHVGWNVFSSNSTLINIQTTSYNKMKTNIQDIVYDAGVADLAAALISTQYAFRNVTSKRQKINIIIMATNPYKQGTKTSEVCGYAAKLKQSAIKTIFIGIGEQWKDARIDCLVENTSTDIIRINNWSEKALNDSLSIIYNILCPTDFTLKITEIKPMKNSSDIRFVEFYNLGIDIQSNDTLTFNGLITGSITDISINQGQYVVLYNVDDGEFTNKYSDAVYIQCGNGSNYKCKWDTSNNMNLTNFNIQIMDNTSNAVYDSVSKNSNSMYWPGIPDGYSYSLEYLGYNNQFGANYIRSCVATGTPGRSNQNCSTDELKCNLNTDCSRSGDQGAYCNANNNGTCICNDIGYYFKQNSCYPIPKPSDCIAYIVKNHTQRYTQFLWNASHIDGNVKYGNTYYQRGLKETEMVTVVDVSRIRNEDDLYSGVTDVAGYVFTRIIDENNIEYNSGKWMVNCTIITESPTPSPTMSPSKSPTIAPSQSPTSAPTWMIPKVFISGDFCNSDRCSCSNQGFDCCLDTNSTFDSDQEEANCTQHGMNYIVGGGEIFQSVSIYPETFPYPTEIQWRIRYNGTVGNDINDIITNNNNTSKENPLGINVYPMNGSLIINGSANVHIRLFLNESNISMSNKNILIGLSAVFIFEIIECSSMNEENMLDECDVIYPYDLIMYIERDDIGNIGGGGGKEDKTPTWIWFVLGAGLVFLALLSWLLYRYWWKGKKQDTDYKLISDDVEFQKVQNDQDFDENLSNNKDLIFNPLATGMPGNDKTHDPLTQEVQKREILQQNDIVEQDAVKEVFREDMGQVIGNLQH